MAKVLLLEDDPVLGQSLFFNLRAENYEPYWAQDLARAQELLQREKFSAFLVDVNLPDGNGIGFCHSLRDSGIDAPIIVLTAQGSEETALSGFAAGVNDFIRKPFGVRELMSRVRLHVFGVRSARENPTRHYEGLAVDFARGHLRFRSLEIPLSRMKLELLDLLISNGGRIVSRENLAQYLKKEIESDRTIDAHISQLRRLLRQHGISHVRISSIYGSGYKLEACEETSAPF